MKRTLPYLCLITALSLLMACAQTPEPAAKTEEAPPTIEGVWKIEEMETIGGPNEGIITDPQPSLHIFTKQHYSIMFVSGIEPRPLFETTTPSEKEIAAAYNVFIANGGTYAVTLKSNVGSSGGVELESSNLVLHPSVAKDPNFMSGGSISYEFQLEGDSLSLILKPDHLIIPGMKVTLPFTEARYKLKRLE